jgi:hypothetical protein
MDQISRQDVEELALALGLDTTDLALELLRVQIAEEEARIALIKTQGELSEIANAT